MVDQLPKMATAVEAYRLLSDVQWNEQEVSGWFLKSDVTLDLKNRLNDLYLLENHSIENDKIKITILHPNTNTCFVKDWVEFLQYKTYRVKAPEDFYVAEDDYWHMNRDIKNSFLAEQYFNILTLIDLLIGIADHNEFDAESKKLIFFHKEKLEIVISYNETNLKSLPSLQSLLKLLKTAPHEEQKQVIFKSVLIETLRNLPLKDRFVRLLNTFDDIFKRVNDNYQVYVSEFSFDKIREEIEDRKLEYMVKLNNAISDIQSKFLAVPIAVLLASGQMENVNKFMFKNFLIMFGVFVFTVILTQLIANQRHTLDAIKKEIEGKAERLKDKHPLLFNEINSAFEDLYKRHTSSLSLLDKMMAAVWSGCIISFAAFVCYTFNCFFP